MDDPYSAPICPALVPATKGVPLYNCSAYLQTQGLTFGNSGRNRVRGLRRVNLDMSIYKVFQLTEKFNIQFRAEAFNIFNHTEWTGVNNYMSTPNFMFSTGAHMPVYCSSACGSRSSEYVVRLKTNLEGTRLKAESGSGLS